MEDLTEWAELRSSLWPSASVESHRNELVGLLSSPKAVAFAALDQDEGLCGFAEATIRHDYVNGCDTSPVVFLEGIFVRPEVRGQDVGRSLVLAVEAWGR